MPFGPKFQDIPLHACSHHPDLSSTFVPVSECWFQGMPQPPSTTQTCLCLSRFFAQKQDFYSPPFDAPWPELQHICSPNSPWLDSTYLLDTHLQNNRCPHLVGPCRELSIFPGQCLGLTEPSLSPRPTSRHCPAP